MVPMEPNTRRVLTLTSPRLLLPVLLNGLLTAGALDPELAQPARIMLDSSSVNEKRAGFMTVRRGGRRDGDSKRGSVAAKQISREDLVFDIREAAGQAVGDDDVRLALERFQVVDHR